jgi:hypothetical protein
LFQIYIGRKTGLKRLIYGWMEITSAVAWDLHWFSFQMPVGSLSDPFFLLIIVKSGFEYACKRD